ncbi:DNA-binding barrel domain superfamily [Sesbania bispinosa]|nr:DNA-binding barrel domain superfamily [Sesbania bispinosa]
MAKPKTIINISSNSDTENERETNPNSWVATMTKAKSSGKQTLCVPKRIRDTLFGHEPDYMFIKYQDEPQEYWELKWHNDPRVRLIGHGWYEFCKYHNLKTNDQITFTKTSNSYVVIVTIQRKRSYFASPFSNMLCSTCPDAMYLAPCNC